MTKWRPDVTLAAAESLRRSVDEVLLPLDVEGAVAARAERSALLAQLDDYLLPRLRAIDAPLLAVVGGSTGAGKSTLVNSILRQQVSRSGVLRPTTRSPVLVHHSDDAAWFADGRVLPSLARVTGADLPDPSRDLDPDEDAEAERVDDLPITSLQLASSDMLPPGVALLDAPDIDSVVQANRDLAQQLLAAADLWIFVTTAARYADAVPWDLLRGAADRGASVAIVLDRVPPEAMDDIRVHLAAMLRTRGLSASPLFTVPESGLDDDGLLAVQTVRPLAAWLVALARDAQARQVVVRRTLTGAVGSVDRRALALGPAVGAQEEAREVLAHGVDDSYTSARARVDDGLRDGSLMRGEVLARWQEFVGTGEMLRTLEERVGRLRDRMVAAARGRPLPTEQLGEALQTGVEVLMVNQAEAAARATASAWRSTAGGRELLRAHPGLGSPTEGLADRAARAVRDWQTHLLELVGTEGGDRRAMARVLSYGVNGTGVLLMLVVFSQTGGLSGAEVGVAGGTAVVAQRLLEAIFGDQAVRALATKAHADLLSRVDVVLAVDRDRYVGVLDGLGEGTTRADLDRAASALRRVG